MRQSIAVMLALLLMTCELHAQIFKKPSVSGIYLQWGYNREWFSKSDIHFSDGLAYDFTLVGAKATDKPDFDAITNAPLDISIPQYNYRIGLYLNPQHTHAIELNFDHAKYVVTDFQRYHITGRISDHYIDKDTVVDPAFLHFEHTDGANFLHLNYVGAQPLIVLKPQKRELISIVYKFGAGIVIPRTDVTYMGKRLNNKFHVAGYILSTEIGMRLYPLRHLFLEGSAKGGYANYVNALASEGGKATHRFYYFELIGLIGYDIDFHRKTKPKA